MNKISQKDREITGEEFDKTAAPISTAKEEYFQQQAAERINIRNISNYINDVMDIVYPESKNK